MNEQWEIKSSGWNCAACGEHIGVAVHFCSILRNEDGADELVRQDFCTACWEKREAAGAPDRNVIAFWRTVRSPKEIPKRGYVKLDIDLVWQIFEGMSPDASDGIEAQLRFVLALMLLRRRRLELAASDPGTLQLVEKKGDRRFRVVDPVLSEERIAELTARLGELLWEREFAALETN